MLKKRVYYNLLQLPQENLSAFEGLEPWQTEDYRSLSDKELLLQIQDLGIALNDIENFALLAEPYESPDEMSEKISAKWETPAQDQLYLNLFELWRRHLPEKRCPTVFCDELDYQIRQFSKGTHQDEELEDYLNYFQQVLDSHEDEGNDPQEIFKTFQSFCAANLEHFLYEYTSKQINEKEIELAYDIVEGFYRYVPNPVWFDFLIVRILFQKSPQKAAELLELVIQSCDQLELAEELLLYTASLGNLSLFFRAVNQAYGLIHTEEEFQELLECVGLHLKEMGEEHTSKQILDLFASRKRKESSKKLIRTEKACQIFEEVVTSNI